MPVRTAYVGTQVAGDVLTAANFTKVPGGWIGYAEVVASQGTITTAVDLTGLTVTVTVGTSRRIRITGHIRVNSTVAGDYCRLDICDGASTILGQGQQQIGASNEAVYATLVLTPTAGAKTYKLMLSRSVGTGSLTMNASANGPAYILVEDLGPAA